MFETIAQAFGNPVALLFFLIALAFLAIALALVVVLHQREKKADLRLKQARADITDMTILFQTMRDIIGQQKKLAKEFNVELEHKMGQVKHILNQGMEKNKQLYEKQLRIAHELEEAQAQIDSIFRQMARTGDGAGFSSLQGEAPRHRANAPLSEPRPREDVLPTRPEISKPLPAPPRYSAPETTAVDSLRAAPRMATPPKSPAPDRPQTAPPVSGQLNGASTGKSILDAVRPAPRPAPPAAPPAEEPKKPDKLEDTGVTKSSFTSWVAEDFSAPITPRANATENHAPAKVATAAPRETPSVRREEEEPAPKNGDAAREAFRALLNIPSEDPAPRARLDLPGQMASMADLSPAEESQDFAQDPANMQQRVLEYSEAGMTVAEVSRELGIGKGEVRLMLSLAKQGAPPNG